MSAAESRHTAVAQVRDQAEAGVVHQIRADIIANALDDGRPYQGKRNHGKGIGKMLGNKILQINYMLRSGNIKQRKRSSRCFGI